MNCENGSEVQEEHPTLADMKKLGALISDACDALYRNHSNLFLVMDNKIVEDCAIQARQSLASYNMDSSKGVHSAPNHFKEAGHYAYWVRKLKPLQVVSLSGLVDMLSDCGIVCDCRNGSLPADNPGVVLVNEYAALHVARAIVRAVEQRHYDALDQNGKVNEQMRRQFQEFRSVVNRRLKRMSDDILMSIRYNSHSPNSMAILMEALLGSAADVIVN
ncbi:hypothetical protein [Magnetospirillum moscoviense]|uniref:hypothetical protein n=1 Tax=Magnetospirillum moscoviense TaxID=1437059 RepID=UPI0012E7226B|nr:hypothetical protein [Magnetospirillum moscoviense]MBF0324871.1 hypothetical protein [Alphaproteobacteria bacterium]